MTHTVKTNWKGNMQFESTQNAGSLLIDAPQNGEESNGLRPKALMLSALAGCSGLDIVSLLKKMRVDITDFSIDIEAELTEEHPKYYKKVIMIFNFYGTDFKKDKIEKAVKLSEEKYCGVLEMFRQFAEVTTVINYFEQ